MAIRKTTENPMLCRFPGVVAMLACFVLSGVARSQSASVTDPPGFHLLLRLEGGKTTYKLGDPIILEVSCYSDLPQRYSASCWNSAELTVAEVAALDSNAKLALDPVQTHWIRGTLCPSAEYITDDLNGEDSLGAVAVGAEAHWQKMTLQEHYPMSAGRFRIRVSTTGLLLPGKQAFTASSMPVEIKVVDDPQERAATLREAIQKVKTLDPFSDPATAFDAEYGNVELFPDLEALRWLISEDGYGNEEARHPNRAAMAKFLREYLDTKVSNDIRLKENVEAVLGLELAASLPKLYARAVHFQVALGKPSASDLRELRAWLLPRYRSLMLEVARSMVTIHKQAPGSFEDDNLEFKAEELVDLNVPECSNTRPFLSESELRHYMSEAGLSSTFITEQIGRMHQETANLRKSD